MIKYETGGYGQNLIQRVEVERETNSTVWVDGRRHAKVSTWKNYFDSWGDAKTNLLIEARKKHDLHQMRLQDAARNIKKIKALTKL